MNEKKKVFIDIRLLSHVSEFLTLCVKVLFADQSRRLYEIYFCCCCLFLSSLFSLLQSSDQEVANKVKAGLKSLIPALEKSKNTSKGIEMLLEKLTA